MLLNFLSVVSAQMHRLFWLLILASLHATADAQIFKCKGENDRYIVQGTPCAENTRPLDNKNPSPEKSGTVVPWKRKYEGPGGNWDPNRAPTPVITYPSPPPPPTPVSVPATPAIAPSYATPRQSKSAFNPVDVTETKAYKEMEAFNKMQRCNHERQQLGVVKMGRPILSYNNKGEPQYVEDANRQAVIAEAERRVAATCN